MSNAQKRLKVYAYMCICIPSLYMHTCIDVLLFIEITIHKYIYKFKISLTNQNINLISDKDVKTMYIQLISKLSVPCTKEFLHINIYAWNNIITYIETNIFLIISI